MDFCDVARGSAGGSSGRRLPDDDADDRRCHATRRRSASQRGADQARNTRSARRARPHVPRHPAAVRGLAVPRPVRAAGGIRRADELGSTAHGTRAVTLQRRLRRRHGRAILPLGLIVITFDDGYRSHYTNALPILRSPRLVGRAQPRPLEPRALRGASAPLWSREQWAAGWEIDAHSLTHPDLTGLAGSASSARGRAARASRPPRRFGVAANFFCYPAGRYDSEVVEAVSTAGFLGATTTEPGLAGREEPFTLDRIRIDGGDGSERAGGEARDAGLEAAQPRSSRRAGSRTRSDHSRSQDPAQPSGV